MRRVGIDMVAFRVVLAATLLIATVLCAVAAVSWSGAHLDQSELGALSSGLAIGLT